MIDFILLALYLALYLVSDERPKERIEKGPTCMFDTMRKRKQIIYLFITAAMILGMGFFGMGNMMANQAQKQAIATVDGQPITSDDFEEELDRQKQRLRQMFGEQADAMMPQFMGDLQSRVLVDLIDSQVLLSEARRLHFSVPDAELVSIIASDPNLQKNGKFDVDSYEKNPRRGEYEARLRESMLRSKFQQYISSRVHLPKSEITVSQQLKETKVDIQYAKITLSSLGKKVAPTVEQKKAVEGDTAYLQSFYATHKEAYAIPAKALIKQIRVGFPFQASETQKNEAKKKIDEIAQKANPSNFSEVAKTSSDDEFAKKGGDAGWVELKAMEEPLRQAIQKLDPGQVSPVVATSFAYYLVKLEEKKPETVKPFDEVKADVVEKAAAERALSDWSEAKTKEWNTLLSAGKNIEADLKKAGVELKKTGPFSLGQGFVPTLGEADPVLDAIFALTPKNPVVKSLIPFEKDLYYVKLLTLERPKEADLAKNAKTFSQTLASGFQMELASQWLKDAKTRSRVTSKVPLKNSAEL